MDEQEMKQDKRVKSLVSCAFNIKNSNVTSWDPATVVLYSGDMTGGIRWCFENS
jgi:hypothetical protein